MRARATLLCCLLMLPFAMGQTCPLPRSRVIAYVSNAGADEVSVIDTRRNRVIGAVVVGDLPVGMAATPDGSRVYVAVLNGNAVKAIDTATNEVVATIPFPGQNPSYVTITADGKFAYVSVPDEVKVIDLARDVAIDSIPLAPAEQPHDLALTPDGSELWVPVKVGAASANTGGVEVIETATKQVIASFSVPGQAQSVVFSPDGSLAYVTNAPLGDVLVIETATLTIVNAVDSGGRNAFDLVISPDGSRVYAGHQTDDALSVLDTASETLLAPIAGTGGSQGMAILPQGRRIYLAQGAEDRVLVVDTARGRVKRAIAVGPAPLDVVIAVAPLRPLR